MMRSTGNFSPEWGYLAPAPSILRTIRVVLVATAVGATAGAGVVCRWSTIQPVKAREFRSQRMRSSPARKLRRSAMASAAGHGSLRQAILSRVAKLKSRPFAVTPPATPCLCSTASHVRTKMVRAPRLS